MAKLNKKQINRIRAIRSQKNNNSVRQIAARLNIPRSTVGDVVSGKTYTNV